MSQIAKLIMDIYSQTDTKVGECLLTQVFLARIHPDYIQDIDKGLAELISLGYLQQNKDKHNWYSLTGKGHNYING